MINKEMIESLKLGFSLVNELELLYLELETEGYESKKTKQFIDRAKKLLLKKKKAAVKTLHDAYTTCHDCGAEFGVYSVGCSSTWTGKCNVCGQEKRVTESRDYGYFVSGIARISRTLKLWNDK